MLLFRMLSLLWETVGTMAAGMAIAAVASTPRETILLREELRRK